MNLLLFTLIIYYLYVNMIMIIISHIIIIFASFLSIIDYCGIMLNVNDNYIICPLIVYCCYPTPVPSDNWHTAGSQ